jgi:hypothetical protein
VLTLLLAGGTAWACSCEGPSVTQEFAQSDRVFQADVVAVVPPMGLRPHTAVLRVTQVHKGPLAPSAWVHFPMPSCGVSAAGREQLLVFAQAGAVTHWCGNTGDLSWRDETVAQLPPPLPAHQARRGRWLWGLLVPLAGILVWARKRRREAA